MLEIIITQNEKVFPLKMDIELNNPNLSTLIGTSTNRLFQYEEVKRKINFKNKILFNRHFNVKLVYGNKIIFDTQKSEYDSVRPFFKFNSTKKSKLKFIQYLYNSVLQVTTHTYEKKDFDNFVKEGKVRNINRNIYERNPKARKECLNFHGYSCKVCGFNFEEIYGRIGEEFIHVHHLTPISSIKDEYELNPLSDLIPVCPNCHAMLHTKTPPIEILELKKIIVNNRNKITTP